MASWRSSASSAWPKTHLAFGLRLDRNAGGAPAEQDRGVVGRQLPVDRDAIERALDADAEQQLGGLGDDDRVGLDEAQHGGEGRLDHPRALGLRRQPDGSAGQVDLDRRTLLEQVGGHDRLLEVVDALGRQRLAGLQQPADHLVAVELHADDAGRADRDAILGGPPHHRPGALHPGGLVHAAAAGGRVGVAGVDGDGLERVEPRAVARDEHGRRRGARAREARGAGGVFAVRDEQSYI